MFAGPDVTGPARPFESTRPLERASRGRPGTGARLVQPPGRAVWYVRFTDRSGRTKERSTGHRDRTEAEGALGRFDPAAGTFVPAAVEGRSAAARAAAGRVWQPEELKVSEAIARYLERRAARLASVRSISYAAERLLEFWGERPLAEITEESVAAYRQRRREGYDGRAGVKNATVNRELMVLRAAIRAVWRSGKLARLPGFPTVNAAPGRDETMSRAEVDRLLAAADDALPHLRLFTYLAIFTAARAGALLELTWDQIDFAHGRIQLNPPGRVQTAKGRAIVPIAGRLAPVLAEARAAAEQAGTLALPLVHWRGRAVKSVRRGFRKLAEAAGLATAGPAKVTPHACRHAAASIMAAAGISMDMIAQFLGQSKERTTRRYVHLLPDYLAPAVAALDGKPIRQLRVVGGAAVSLAIDNPGGPP
ncbi:MAG: tyrosine-type recombinase/integrase [Azospirillum sp.]|nr:tyrosine-type recombinase/integrase [Azospirillum sp.]